MQPARNLEEYEAQIAEIREGAAKRRAEAWAMVPDTILGVEVNAITPAIYTLLVATDNAYVYGRVPVEADLRNFVWFCSPYFNPDSPTLSLRWKPWQMYKLNRALGCFLPKKYRAKIVNENFYRACLQIHTLIANTFKDGLPGNEESLPLAAAFEAQMLDTFAREYRQWPLPKPVRHTPIKQLYQLARCIDRAMMGKNAPYYDRDEILCEQRFLESMNAKN